MNTAFISVLLKPNKDQTVAPVFTNQITSQTFTLCKDVHSLQYCSYYSVIKDNDNITCITSESFNHKIYLYAGNVISFLQNPVDSPFCFNQFVDWNKSTIYRKLQVGE